jgi:hypothetical protein
MSKTATFFVTLLGAFAVAAVFQLKHLMRVPETLYAEVAEVIGRGLGLFAIGWGIAGIAYLASGRAGFGAKLSLGSPASPSWSVPPSQNSKIRAS